MMFDKIRENILEVFAYIMIMLGIIGVGYISWEMWGWFIRYHAGC